LGIRRKEQICNHPSHWLGDGAWAEDDSGKWARLRELSEVIAAKQEKALVFRQFREVTARLGAFLGSVFGRPGLVLHGETEVKKRQELGSRRKSRFPSSCCRSRRVARWLEAQLDRRLARGALRPLVEPGGREPGHRPGVPHRPDEERSGPQIRLQGNRRREDRLETGLLQPIFGYEGVERAVSTQKSSVKERSGEAGFDTPFRANALKNCPWKCIG